MRPLLVGQAPGRTSRPDRPLIGGRAGALLIELSSVGGLKGYVRAFDRRNVLDAWPGRNGAKGDLFPLVDARASVAAMIPDLGGRRVIMLGRAVSSAFDLRYLSWFEWHDDPRGFRVAPFPHPSPVNKFWNSPTNRDRGRVFFRQLLEQEPS